MIDQEKCMLLETASYGPEMTLIRVYHSNFGIV